MMTQTWALLLDGYRELNARKLFWITLILSAVFIIGFGFLGADASGFKVLWFHWDVPMADYVYKQIFSWVLIGFWLTWVAAILALTSTAGMFPDLLTGGAIDLYLSKPLGRLRLFLTKYVTGLLFVTLQVALVAIGGIILLGWRGGEWKPHLLMAIPIVVCFFSYLFSICVLLGVATRSTIAALLLTMVGWGFFWAVHKVELETFKLQVSQDYMSNYYQERLKQTDASIAELQAHPQEKNKSKLEDLQQRRATEVARQGSVDSSDKTIGRVHSVAYITKTLVPKTTETIDLLDRYLFSDAEVEKADERTMGWVMRGDPNSEMAAQMNASQHAAAKADEAVRNRSVGWIIGSSLVFEAVMLSLAAWVFCRRDY
jgi:hypothetical protein